MDGGEWTEDVPTYTDAQSHKVSVKATNPNYTDTPAVDVTMTINKAAITVTTSPKQFTYDPQAGDELAYPATESDPATPCPAW